MRFWRGFAAFFSLASLGCAAGSGGGSGDDGDGGSAGSLLPPNAFGSILVSSIDGTDHDGGVARSASFSAGYRSSDALPPGCSEKDFGPCVLSQCVFVEGVEAESSSFDAGDISFTGTSVSPTLVADAFGEYASFNAMEPAFVPGSLLSTAISGSDRVDPHGLSVTSPAAPAILMSIPDSGTVVVDASQDIHLSWSGGAGATVSAGFVTASQNADEIVLILCKFPIEQGSGTIPQSALQFLQPGGLLSRYSFEVEAVATERVGDVEVTFAASSPATIAGSGALARGDITFLGF